MKPHKWKDVIIQWANGAAIQLKDRDGKWINTISNSPSWDETIEYRASIAEVEGKPVFEGDVLYFRGYKRIADDTDNFGAPCTQFWSWNPPLPKTITVTIPRPDRVECGVALRICYSESNFGDADSKYHKAFTAIDDALKEKP